MQIKEELLNQGIEEDHIIYLNFEFLDYDGQDCGSNTAAAVNGVRHHRGQVCHAGRSKQHRSPGRWACGGTERRR